MAVRPASEGKFEFDVPVVVVGAGSCGLAAALVVLGCWRRGPDSRTGRKSYRQHLTLRRVSFRQPAPAFNAETGIEDSAELFAADLSAKAKGQNDPMYRESGGGSYPDATIDWLADQHGIELHLVEVFLLPWTFALADARTRKTRRGLNSRNRLLAAAATGRDRHHHRRFGRRSFCR